MAFNPFEESIVNTPLHVTLNRMARPLAVGALLAVGGVTAGWADERAMDAVLRDYETGHYQRAFDRVALLADAGHCEAARLARDMARHGPRLFAQRFNVAAERLARWQLVPRCEAPSALAVRSTQGGIEQVTIGAKFMRVDNVCIER